MRTRVRTALVAAACMLALSLPSAQAAKVYRWRDWKGATQYGDHPPAPGAHARDLTEVMAGTQPGAMVRLRITREAEGYLAWADNELSGPVEVRMRFVRRDNVRGEPELPARALVRANDSALVARLLAVDPAREPDFELSLDAVPGNPSAKPRDVEYVFPLLTDDVRVQQGYGGRYSHADAQNFHAVDFAAQIGTDVVAARDGTVMQVEGDFNQAGLDREQLGGRANFVRIAHDDGTMALYAHLREDGVLVRVGQRVRAGQLIGRSGNTGFTSGPHLHFAVQVNRGMRLESIPFRMFGPGGILRFSQSR